MIDPEKELRELEAAVSRTPRAKKAAPGEKAATPRREETPAARQLTLRQVKSGICTPKDHKATLAALGFRRLGQRVVREDRPEVRGMVRKVRHLVEIVED